MSNVLEQTVVCQDDICDRASLDWGADSSLSIATNRRVLIYSFNFQERGEKCLTSARIPTDTFFGAFTRTEIITTLRKAEDFFKSVNKNGAPEVLSMYYDHAINSKIISSDLHGFKRTKWSPKGADHCGRCVLTTLALDHRLCLYSRHKTKNKWSLVIDISEYLKKDVMKKSEKDSKKEHDIVHRVKQMKEVSYLLATQDMTWSHMMKGGDLSELALLITATRCGHIVCYKMFFPVINQKSCQHLITLDTSVTDCVSIQWCHIDDNTGVAVIGYLNGQIKVFVVKMAHDGSIVHGSITDLWNEADLISVTNFIWNKKERLLYAAKGLFVMLFELKVDDMTVNVSKSTHLCIGASHMINGMAFLHNDVLVTTDSGHEFIIQTSKDQDLALTYQPYDTKVVKPEELISHGLATSPNNLICLRAFTNCKAASLTSETMPQRSQIILQSSPDLEEVVTLLFKQQDNNCVQDFKDAILVLSCQMNKDFDSMPARLQNLLNEKDKWSELSLFLVKVARLLTCLRMHKKKIDFVQQDFLDLTKVLLIYCVKDCLQRSFEFKHDWSKEEQQSLFSMCVWVSKYAPELKQLSDSLLLELKPDDDYCELCDLCQSKFKDIDFETSVCENGHKFKRCCKTLRICQTVDYNVCLDCGALYLANSKLRFVVNINPLSCLLCDGILS